MGVFLQAYHDNLKSILLLYPIISFAIGSYHFGKSYNVCKNTTTHYIVVLEGLVGFPLKKKRVRPRAIYNKASTGGIQSCP